MANYRSTYKLMLTLNKSCHTIITKIIARGLDLHNNINVII